MNVLEEANRLIHNDRCNDYGGIGPGVRAYKHLFNGYLSARREFSNDPTLTESDSVALMILVKLSRIASGVAKRDNWTDIAGYAGLGAVAEGHDDEGGIYSGTVSG